MEPQKQRALESAGAVLCAANAKHSAALLGASSAQEPAAAKSEAQHSPAERYAYRINSKRLEWPRRVRTISTAPWVGVVMHLHI